MIQPITEQEKIIKPRRLDPEDTQHILAEIQERLYTYQLEKESLQKQDNNEIHNQENFYLTIEKHESELRSLVNDLHPADIAFILESLPKNDRQIIWALVSRIHNADILIEVQDWIRQSLIDAMNHQDLIAATGKMDTDELADLAPNLPPDIVAEVQKGLSKEEQAQLLAAMGYPEDSVGAIMDFEMVRVREDVTLEVVLRYLRRLHRLPDHTDQIFVVDRQDKLQGCLQVTKLLVSEPETDVSAVMNRDFLALNPLDFDADAAVAFERYDLVSAPVIDDQGRLIGRMTIASVVDVIQEDSQEQELSRAGLQEEDIFAPITMALKNRAPWLLFNICTAATASFIASQFENTVSQIVILAFLMSIVAGIGGNSGNQSMTMIIRALAMGRITGRSLWQLVKRELIVTSIVGLLGSFVAAIFAWSISKSVSVALVMMGAMICNMLVGASMGVLVPMLRARFGKDPAVGSSVLLTFATDSLGFFIFLGLATLFLI
ncbi:MAG: magnesium transporter [Bordetella sp.]|nr:MAG: magnesium transporter [Bordetella sp.]